MRSLNYKALNIDLKALTAFVLIYTVPYCFAAFILIPFLVTWGVRELWLRRYYYFLLTPLPLEYSIYLLPLNGMIWGFITYCSITFLFRLFKK
jgi:hypothetical protein